MILCTVGSSWQYRSVSPALDMALGWLCEHFSDKFVSGSMEIGDAGSGPVIVKCEEPSLLPRERVSLEAHRRFIDIHVPLKGPETIGWAPLESLHHPRGAYDPDKDIIFYGDGAHSLLHLKVGQMAIFFPDDAHAPNIGLGTHRKLCVKIPVG